MYIIQATKIYCTIFMTIKYVHLRTLCLDSQGRKKTGSDRLDNNNYCFITNQAFQAGWLRQCMPVHGAQYADYVGALQYKAVCSVIVHVVTFGRQPIQLASQFATLF